MSACIPVQQVTLVCFAGPAGVPGQHCLKLPVHAAKAGKPCCSDPKKKSIVQVHAWLWESGACLSPRIA